MLSNQITHYLGKIRDPLVINDMYIPDPSLKVKSKCFSKLKITNIFSKKQNKTKAIFDFRVNIFNHIKLYFPFDNFKTIFLCVQIMQFLKGQKHSTKEKKIIVKHNYSGTLCLPANYFIIFGCFFLGWRSCANDLACASKCVQAYMSRYIGFSGCSHSCESYARIHNGGPAGCKHSNTLGYWSHVHAQGCSHNSK